MMWSQELLLREFLWRSLPYYGREMSRRKPTIVQVFYTLRFPNNAFFSTRSICWQFPQSASVSLLNASQIPLNVGSNYQVTWTDYRYSRQMLPANFYTNNKIRFQLLWIFEKQSMLLDKPAMVECNAKNFIYFVLSSMI